MLGFSKCGKHQFLRGWGLARQRRTKTSVDERAGTRRSRSGSADVGEINARAPAIVDSAKAHRNFARPRRLDRSIEAVLAIRPWKSGAARAATSPHRPDSRECVKLRSEEHTSELQS